MAHSRFPTSTLCIVAATAEAEAVVSGLKGHSGKTGHAGSAGATDITVTELPVWTPIQVVQGFWVLRTGVSKANAAGATAAALAGREGTWDLVLSLGIAGTLSPSVRVGDVVLAQWDAFGDEGVGIGAGLLPLAQMGFGVLGGTDSVQADAAATQWVHSRLKTGGFAVHLGGCATVSTCSGTDQLAAGVAQRTGAIAESMEGAAVLLAAHHAGIAAGQVRIISNTCGERDRQVWDLRGALATLQRVTAAIAGHGGNNVI